MTDSGPQNEVQAWLELCDRLAKAMDGYTQFGVADAIVNVLGVRAAETLIQELT